MAGNRIGSFDINPTDGNIIFARGSFYSESAIRSSNLQISKKNIPNYYPELEIWICCLLLLAVNLNFMFKIVIWNIFFWRFEKHIALSEKKATFRITLISNQVYFLFWHFSDSYILLKSILNNSSLWKSDVSKKKTTFPREIPLVQILMRSLLLKWSLRKFCQNSAVEGHAYLTLGRLKASKFQN